MAAHDLLLALLRKGQKYDMIMISQPKEEPVMYKITTALIVSYHSYLIDEEKAPSTVSKYVRDVQAFVGWLQNRDLDKSAVLAYKSYLIESCAPASVNASISSLNSFFSFCEW